MLFSRKTALLFACGFLWAPSLIANTVDAQQPISIEADHAVLDEKNQTSVYTGHVILRQGGIEVKANTVTVVTNEGRLQRVIVEGDPVDYTQQQQGHEDIRGVSERMEYDTETKHILLLGNAELWQGGNRFSGKRIQYDTEQGKVIATGNTNSTETEVQRVEITLQPRSSQTKSLQPKFPQQQNH
jgi:lipopolysaccharide export system protein LptA